MSREREKLPVGRGRVASNHLADEHHLPSSGANILSKAVFITVGHVGLTYSSLYRSRHSHEGPVLPIFFSFQKLLRLE